MADDELILNPDDAMHRSSPRARPMTPDEVLQVLIDLWRHREGIDPQPQVALPITRETNVKEVANLCGMPRFADDWIDIAFFLQEMFKISIPKDEWKALLHPKRSKPIGPVADAIADCAIAPAVERELEDGVELSEREATFRTMLLIFEDAGLSVGHFSPSTSLRPILVCWPAVITLGASRIAPGRLPPLREVNVSFRAGLVGLLLWVVMWRVNTSIGHPWLEAAAWVSLIVGVGSLALSSTRSVKSLRLGELRTLGDVCDVLSTPAPDLPPPLPPDEDGVIPRWTADDHPHYDVSALQYGDCGA